MPQLDNVTYFSQFVFLLLSFLTVYYFVITNIMPATLTAHKLRAKFNSQHENPGDSSSLTAYAGGSVLLDKSTSEALGHLTQKSATSLSIEDLVLMNKIGKSNLKSAFLFHHAYVLANKKQLIDSQLAVV